MLNPPGGRAAPKGVLAVGARKGCSPNGSSRRAMPRSFDFLWNHMLKYHHMLTCDLGGPPPVAGRGAGAAV